MTYNSHRAAWCPNNQLYRNHPRYQYLESKNPPPKKIDLTNQCMDFCSVVEDVFRFCITQCLLPTYQMPTIRHMSSVTFRIFDDWCLVVQRLRSYHAVLRTSVPGMPKRMYSPSSVKHWRENPGHVFRCNPETNDKPTIVQL